jgi:glycosyltransferase involved in cell wall biosynthesis
MAYFRIAVRIAIARASMIITDSMDAARKIETHLHVLPESLRVVYLGATQRKVSEADSDFGDEYSPYLLFTGATEPHKNVHTLVEAFAILVKKPDFAEYKLIIAGVPGGGHQRVLDSISRNHLDEKVLFLGFLTDSRLSALYEKAALFVFPSKAEGFGLPPLEAMGHGTPVAAADASCIPEILGDAAKYFDPDDPKNMEQVIHEVLENTEDTANMVENGKARAAEFSWERCALATLAVYRETLNAKRETTLRDSEGS